MAIFLTRVLAKAREISAVSLLLMLLVCISAGPLFQRGWYFSHENTDPLQRVMAMSYEIQQGTFSPGWMSTAYGGKGSPFFVFYSPLFYLVASYVHLLGVPLLVALKALCTALFFVGALGMYLWTRRHYSAVGAFTSAVLYLFAPYHFVDLYVRGALAEFTALAFLPFLFLGIDLSFSRRASWRGRLLTAFASAAIMISHNLSAFMILLFAMIYFASAAWQARAGIRQWLFASTGPLLGAGLCAFYWLPVIVEKKYLRNMDAALTTGMFSYTNHFVYFHQLFSMFWGFGGSVPGPDDEMSFQIGVVLLIFMVIGLLSMKFINRRRRVFSLTLFSLGWLAVFFTLEFSGIFYRLLPGLGIVQFPWRFLGPATLFLAAFGGSLPDLSRVHPHLKKLPIALALLCALVCVFFSGEQRAVNRYESVEILNDNLVIATALKNREMGPLCQMDEYLPVAVTPKGLKTQFPKPPMPMPDNARIENVAQTGAIISFGATAADSGGSVTMPMFYFPGWKVSIDDAPVQASANPDGFLTFSLPPQQHHVKVWFGMTTDRLVGRIISACSLAAALILALWCAMRSRAVRSMK